MVDPIALAGTAEWSGENPGVYLKEKPDGVFVTANKATSEIMRYAVEFGMTPSARSRVDAGVPFNGGKFTGVLGPRIDPAERYFAWADDPGDLDEYIAANPSIRQPQ